MKPWGEMTERERDVLVGRMVMEYMQIIQNEGGEYFTENDEVLPYFTTNEQAAKKVENMIFKEDVELQDRFVLANYQVHGYEYHSPRKIPLEVFSKIMRPSPEMVCKAALIAKGISIA